MQVGTLYIVATPIGNLEDITLRAIRILKEVNLVLCEDTRVTQKLLNHFEIENSLMRFDSHIEDGGKKRDEIIGRLVGGENIALVTDAGTPLISDPGYSLVAHIQENHSGITVVTIPGASAVVAALSIAGIPCSSFYFGGFPPHKKGRKTFFENLLSRNETLVLYESPHRLLKTLDSLRAEAGNRTIAVCRELTKLHESVVRGVSADVFVHFEQNSQQVKGECVVIIGPTPKH